MKLTGWILISTVALALTFALAASHISDRIPDIADSTGALTLPNGWRITPAGRHVKLPGDLPMKMALTGGSQLLVLTAGYHDHSLNVIDVRTAERTATLDVVKAWDGMAFDPVTGTAYLSGGGLPKRNFANVVARITSPMKSSMDKPILRVRLANGKLVPQDPIAIAGLEEKDRFISGVTLGPDGGLYVLNLQTDTLYRLDGEDFSQQMKVQTGYRPYAAVFAPDGRTLAVSNWGDQSVSLFDAGSLREMSRIAVGSHPNEMIWAKDGRLFVADSGSNEVSVIAGGKVVEAIRTSLDPKAPLGSTPDALALSPDGRRLYVANADNNNVAVVDVANPEESHVLGFIPTGWYPTALAVAADGKQIYVGTGKGMGFRNNVPATTPYPQKAPDPKTPYDYIGAVLSGHVSIVDVPDARQLTAYTKQAVATCPLRPPLWTTQWRRRSSATCFRRSTTCSTSSGKTAPMTRCSATSGRGTAILS